MEIKSKLSCAFTVPKYTGMGWVRDLHGFLVKIMYLCVLHLMCTVTYTLHFLEHNNYYCFKIVSIPWELNNIQFSIVICWGAWDGAVVRALTSNQCGPGSNMWVEFVAGSLVCSEGFFSGYSGFPLYSNLIRNQVDEEQLCGCANPKSLFIHFLFRN